MSRHSIDNSNVTISGFPLDHTLSCFTSEFYSFDNINIVWIRLLTDLKISECVTLAAWIIVYITSYDYYTRKSGDHVSGIDWIFD